MLNRTAICTIACENYLPFVRILAASLREHHPELPFYTLLLVEGDVVKNDAIEQLGILEINDLSAPEIDARLNLYDQKQLSASLKPSLLKHLMKQGYATVVFLDPDMLVTSSLNQVIPTVAQHSLTLTPHILHPNEAAGLPDLDKILLHSGMFNAGFIGVSSTPEALYFLDWWEKRLAVYCLNKPAQGMHYDQRWLDHALGFVSSLHVLRDPGVNAAYWNLISRNIVFDGQYYQIDGSRLKCIHFSGFDPSLLPQATCYFTEIDIRQFGPLSALFDKYKKDLVAQGLTVRTRAAESGNSGMQHATGYFETSLTTAEIKQLGQKAKITQHRSMPRSAPCAGKFLPLSAFAISGIRKRYGWNEDEAWGMWSRGTYADLLLTVPENLQSGMRISFMVQAFVSKLHPKQEMNVFLNGNLVEKWSFDRSHGPVLRQVCVDQDACSKGMVVLGFQLLNPASPLSLGINSDSRILGLGMRGLKIDRIGSSKYTNYSFTIEMTFRKVISKLRYWFENQRYKKLLVQALLRRSGNQL